jgi:hypothetical protein
MQYALWPQHAWELTARHSMLQRANRSGLIWLPQYRMAANYKDPKFLSARIGDKLLTCVVLIILYVGACPHITPVQAAL